MKRPGKYNKNNQIKLVANNQIMNLQIRAIRQQQSGINERNFYKYHQKLHHGKKCSCADKAPTILGLYLMPNKKILNSCCPYQVLAFLKPLGKQAIELYFTPVTN